MVLTFPERVGVADLWRDYIIVHQVRTYQYVLTNQVAGSSYLVACRVQQ